MTYPGLGGQQQPSVNAPAGQALSIGVQAGTQQAIVRAREVIIAGASGGLFVYAPSAGAGNLVSSVTATAGVDPYGNNYLVEVATYSGAVAMQMTAGQIIFYTGSLAAGWTSAAQIFLNTGVIELITTGGVITANNTLDNGAGGASFGAVAVSSLTIGGSSNTGNANLSNSGIAGTSGGASAGTAHTHGPGSFAVANDLHHHPL